MPELMRADVTTDLISITALTALVTDEHCGAIVTFTGDVRNHDGGKEVLSLTYEIHPSAGDKIT